jgi:hypothetical protein
VPDLTEHQPYVFMILGSSNTNVGDVLGGRDGTGTLVYRSMWHITLLFLSRIVQQYSDTQKAWKFQMMIGGLVQALGMAASLL